MSWGTTSIERAEPQVSLILRCIRTLHTLEEGRIQKHSVYCVFPHHYHDWHRDDPSAQDVRSGDQTSWSLTKSGTVTVRPAHVEFDHTSSPLAPLVLLAQYE